MDSTKRFLQTKNASFSLDGTRILVVEDSLDTRKLFTFILEGCGAEVAAVASVQEALEVIKQMLLDRITMCHISQQLEERTSLFSYGGLGVLGVVEQRNQAVKQKIF